MGKYDYVDREYFSDRERFAELITYGIFGGKVRISAADIQAETGHYSALGNAQGTLERDVLFHHVGHGVRYGMEIENYSDYRMPERCMVYDACDYEKQVGEIAKRHLGAQDLKGFTEKKSKMKKGDLVYPVLTLVLYLGKKNWEGYDSFEQMYEIPVEFRKHIKGKVADYKISVLNANGINPELFHTDLRQFFIAMQCRGSVHKIKELADREDFMNLSQDAQNAIAVHLGDKQIIQRVVEEGQNVCKAMREWKKELLQEGRDEGIEQGIERGEARLTNLLTRLMEKGRVQELSLALTNMELRRELYAEFNL